MIHNPEKTRSVVDMITRRNPLHMLYVSIDQTMPIDSDGEFREFLELDLEEVHVAVNLINNNDKANMMSWDVIHKANGKTKPCCRYWITSGEECLTQD